ncbi:MAG: Clp protease N-terminal domain-containing protein, partial [Bryobacteraceae bacterium]
MDFNRFTEKLQEGVHAAQSQASSHGQQQLDVEHLLLALLEQEGGLAQSILVKAAVNLEAVHRRLTQELERLPRVSGSAAGIDQIYV